MMKALVCLLIGMALNQSLALEPAFSSSGRSGCPNIEEGNLLVLSSRSPQTPNAAKTVDTEVSFCVNERLPQDIKAHIFSYLSSNKELLNIQNVCTSWRQPVHITLANREITLSSTKFIEFLQGSSEISRKIFFPGTHSFHVNLDKIDLNIDSLEWLAEHFSDITFLELNAVKIITASKFTMKPKKVGDLVKTLTRLTKLGLYNYDKTSPVPETFLKNVATLVSLDLSGTYFESKYLASIKRHQTGLKTLAISKSIKANDASLRKELNTKIITSFPNLINLDLSENNLSADIAALIPVHMINLQRLNLCRNNIGNRGFEDIIKGCHKLIQLNVASNLISLVGYQEASLHLPSTLTSLDLSSSSIITDNKLKAITPSENLQVLIIADNPFITPGGISFLRSNFPNLKQLVDQ